MTSLVKWSDYCTFFKAAECSLPSLPWNFFLHFTNPIDTISSKKIFISSINAILKFHFLHFRAVSVNFPAALKGFMEEWDNGKTDSPCQGFHT